MQGQAMIAIPKIRRVRQASIGQPVVDDIPGAVAAAVRASKIRERVRPGGTVAVTAGSRGIANIALLVRATVDVLKVLGFKPFVVAAMGTHGGGTSAGQRQVLADYGITESTMGCDVRTDMETVEVGVNDFDAPVYWDANAFRADGVVALNRVKAHTDFVGPIESGVVKMLVIGLGKRESPQQVHRLGSRGMAEMVPASGRVLLAKTKFALGLAVIENAAEETAIIQAIEPEELFEVEPKLLVQAKELMARLPFDRADLLLVGELGKNYSGTGMDTNVIGRRFIEAEDDFPTPRITRLAVFDVSPESHGNAVGCGLADVTTERLVAAIDHAAFRLNTLTAQYLMRSRIPLAFPTDRDVAQTCLDTCWQPVSHLVKMAVIPNTLELTELFCTDPLVADLKREGRSIEIDDPMEIPFTAADRIDFPGLFPHSLAARRIDKTRDVAFKAL
ncbi:MAG: lactate racemase domain-containing protein [Planctomycetia bacterium]